MQPDQSRERRRRRRAAGTASPTGAARPRRGSGAARGRRGARRRAEPPGAGAWPIGQIRRGGGRRYASSAIRVIVGGTVGPSLPTSSARPSRVNAALGDDVAGRAGERLGDPGAQVQQVDLAAAVDVPHQRGARARRVERDEVQIVVVAAGDEVRQRRLGVAVEPDGQQRGPLAPGVGVHEQLPAGDPETGVGDVRLAAGEQLGAPPAAQVEQLQPAGAAAADAHHGAHAVAADRADQRRGAGGEHRRRPVAHVDETRHTVARPGAEDRDPELAPAGRPGAQRDRRGARGEVVDLRAVRGDEPYAGALAPAGSELAGDPVAVGRPGDLLHVPRDTAVTVVAVAVGRQRPGRLGDRGTVRGQRGHPGARPAVAVGDPGQHAAVRGGDGAGVGRGEQRRIVLGRQPVHPAPDEVGLGHHVARLRSTLRAEFGQVRSPSPVATSPTAQPATARSSRGWSVRCSGPPAWPRASRCGPARAPLRRGP